MIEGYTTFPRESFAQHIKAFYPLAIELLGRDLNSEIRISLQSFLRRVGEVALDITAMQSPLGSPVSRRNSATNQYFTFNNRKNAGESGVVS